MRLIRGYSRRKLQNPFDLSALSIVGHVTALVRGVSGTASIPLGRRLAVGGGLLRHVQDLDVAEL